MRNRDMPAKPHEWRDITEHGGEMLRETFFGLTKLEEAAMRAMQGILAGGFELSSKAIIEESVRLANALFDELEKAELEEE